MKKINYEKGFTIIELLIVITIIGILLAVAVISYNSIVDRANRDACLSNQRMIEIARAFNHVNYGKYGDNMNELTGAFALMGFNMDSALEKFKCPSNGIFSFSIETLEVTCSIEGHN